MIGIVSYGLGNIEAIVSIYKRLKIPVVIADSPDALHSSDRLILPGVGAFDWAMDRLNNSGLRPALEHAALQQSKPTLGICVGMQMLAKSSEEGLSEGLGWIDGHVKRFSGQSPGGCARLPHMGWNDVQPQKNDPLFRGLEKGARFYFLHSYFFCPASEEHILATTNYLDTYASAVRSGRIFGVQFHPEKSHEWGIRLLKNFAEL